MSGCETLTNGTKVYTSEHYRIMQDSLLLARFALRCLHSGFHGSLLDICAGSGAVGLTMLDEGFCGNASFVEIDKEACRLLRCSITENGLGERCDVFEGDLLKFRTSAKFDVAVCNPPYFDCARGAVASDKYCAGARCETLCTLDDVLSCAARSLKERGRLYICYRPERLSRLFCAAERCSFAPKALAFVRNAQQKEPWLALVELRWRGGEGLHILPDIIIK